MKWAKVRKENFEFSSLESENGQENLHSRRAFLQKVALAGTAAAIGSLSGGSQFHSVQALRVGSIQNVQPASYIIFIDSGGVVNAIDGNSGTVVKSDTDAQTVIQYAINQLVDGGLIFLRQRANTIYTINRTITVPANIFIIGEGNRPVLQTASQGDFPIFTVTGQEVGFFNFQLLGNKASSPNATSQKAFLVQGPSPSGGGYRFENLQINNFKNHGIHFLGVSKTQGDVNIDHCNVYLNDQDGIRLETVYGFNITNSFIGNNLGSGIAIVGCGEGYIANNNITTKNGHGINLYNALNVTITGNEINDNRYNGILVNQNTTVVTITGNTCNNNNSPDQGQGWNGIQVSNGSNGVTIAGNSCRNIGGNNTQAYGITVTDTSDGIIVIGNDLRGNKAQGLNMVISATKITSTNLT
jgi:hypothetical protein